MSTRKSKVDTSPEDTLKQWISGEITLQLRELKQQINREIIEDLEIIKKQVTEDVIRDVTARLQPEIDRKARGAVNRIGDDLRRELDDTVDKKISGMNNQIVLANDRQIAMVKQTTKELVMAVGQQVTNSVYTKVIGEINEKIVPKVNNMVEYVQYQMQDGGEVVTNYRRAVEAQSNKHLQPGMKMITDGKNDRQVISENVRLFFSPDSDSDSD